MKKKLIEIALSIAEAIKTIHSFGKVN